MAFYIESGAIYLTKGDDAVLEVSSIAADYPALTTDDLEAIRGALKQG